VVVVARRYKNGLSFSYGELTANHNQLSDVIAQKQLGLNVLALIRIYVSPQWYFKYKCLGFNDMRLAFGLLLWFFGYVYQQISAAITQSCKYALVIVSCFYY